MQNRLSSSVPVRGWDGCATSTPDPRTRFSQLAAPPPRSIVDHRAVPRATVSTSGESDLSVLLRSAAPQLRAGEFVFVCVPAVSDLPPLAPVGTFIEAEGVTAICRREQAEAAGLRFDGRFRQITLTIHSSLQAVGFLAAVSAQLARHGIPCNAVSAFHHDHLFVPAADAGRAVQVLQELAATRGELSARRLG